MKILIVSELVPYPELGGLARHAINLANYLSGAGHDVAFLGNQLYSSKEYIAKTGLKCNLFIEKSLSLGKWAGRVNRHFGIYPSWSHIKTAKRIASSILKRCALYDVVHYHGHYPILLNYLPSDVNIVITHHDSSLVCPRKTLLQKDLTICREPTKNGCQNCFDHSPNKLYRYCVKYGIEQWRHEAQEAVNRHKHIFVSERLKTLNLRCFNTQKYSNINVIHNFIDCSFITKELSNLPEKKKEAGKRIFIANSVNAHKGIRLFLESCKKNGVFEENISISIAGDGAERQFLQHKFSNYPVFFLGQLSYEKVIEQMVLSDIYVLPSICEESCSTGVLEALFMNKEVLALQRGGTPELKRYAQKGQLKLYSSIDTLVTSLMRAENVFWDQEKIVGDFGACLAKKVEDIFRVYHK